MDVTLRWATWLTANASETSNLRLQQAFLYSGQSSGAMDNVAQVFAKMVRRLQDFINLLHEHANERSIQRLDMFIEKSAGLLDLDFQELENAKDEEQAHKKLVSVVGALSKVWTRAQPMVSTIRSKLPAAIGGLKKARKEVATTSKVLDSVFKVMEQKGPSVFNMSSETYRTILIAYFVTFAFLTLATLYYAFYAHGYVAGDAPMAEEFEYAEPRSARSMCRVCWRECWSCFNFCDGGEMCFWSLILLVEVVWLLMFVVSGVLLLCIGAKEFLAAGCAPIYMLGNASVLGEELALVTRWLGGGDAWLAAVPGSRNGLLVCNILSVELGRGILFAAFGNLVAAVLSFQIITDSASMHERLRCLKVFDQGAI